MDFIGLNIKSLPMKKLLYLFPLLLSLLAHAQEKEIISIIENETYELNGGLRSQFGGRSRIALPINIPSNASTIVYTIQAYRKGESVSKNLNFAMALGTYVNTGSMTIASAVSKVEIPSGTTTADAILLGDRNDKDQFLAKNDNNWRSYHDANRLACVECKSSISFNPYNKPQIIFLGLRNPSSLDPITIVVNVVAISQ
jgi:hypothetical protein